MAHGSRRKTNGDAMTGLEFMNQDGEWERFPTDEELIAKKEIAESIDALKVRIICHLCNEPAPTDKIHFFQMGAGLTWSCEKCHAVSTQ
jgi:hypothetical protein